MTLIKVLNEVGLSEKEAKVYLTLLEMGEAIPSTISRRSLIKRPTVYVTLEILMEKGLVSRVKKGNILFYRALSPEAVLEKQSKKLEMLKGSLPELLNLKQKYEVTPQMSVFEGVEGIIQIMEDSLTTNGEILCWSNADLAVNTVLAEYHPEYLKKKIQRKIQSKCLFLYDKVGLNFKKNSVKELREVYLIPKDKYPFENEINIYDDKMSIISHSDAVGVIIQNKAIANTQRSIFNFAFEYAKILEKKLLTKKDLDFLNSKERD